jgi:hypothetical protein
LNPHDAHIFRFYRKALTLLRESGVPFLIGGAYALERYTGIERHTKDFDVFLLPEDAPRVLDYFAARGYRTEMTFPHWLGKVYEGDECIDLIFSSGNGVARVDRAWLEHATAATLWDTPVMLCPVEETIWSKSFVLERERYDGADVAHLLRARGADLDWRRLLDRFDGHWRVLFSHLILFGFIYPGERDRIPAWVMQEMVAGLRAETGAGEAAEHVCQGTLLSRAQYLPDVEQWGYRDPRVRPKGTMTQAQVDRWTAPAREEHL